MYGRTAAKDFWKNEIRLMSLGFCTFQVEKVSRERISFFPLEDLWRFPREFRSVMGEMLSQTEELVLKRSRLLLSR
ncbi:hypothetical protein TNIN_439921 [Trichonephila inaurata madagascariensis]|uniref:Uncharacterized protein n=1 Tax=Trichonephila inaurata madagascariensis TaxID=2747483 RepID=A0A8X6KCY9_9ARAC|nr:hypothetical protein TNIN_439921 [Trichonephila inaurata madagascariensis]